MRFNLHLSVKKQSFGNVLPLSYQYELSAYIYHVIAKGNANYAEWLHQNGFTLDGKQFRLFSFSNLQIDKISIDKALNRLILLSENATLQISFLPEQSTEEFVKGVFAEQTFTLGGKQSKVQFTVQQVEMLPTPAFEEELQGITLSPICLSRKTEEGKVHYYSPDEAQAGQAILNNLINKYEAFYGKPYEGDTAFEWEVLSEPRSKLITMKAGTPQQTRVKAYNCSFRLKADKELLRIGYECGLGEKGSMGFGMVK
jgi:CRISPR-associated endoribonuclease Cas6